MAYGRIKADTLVFDNSGSDVELTVSAITTGSLSSYAPLAGAAFTGGITGTTAGFTGNVGIGTTTGDARLTVNSSGARAFEIENSGSSDSKTLTVNQGNANNGSSATVLDIGSNSGNSILTTGNVGIGTTSPDGLLTVRPSSGNSQIFVRTNDTTSRSQLIFGNSADSNVGGVQYDHSDNSMQFHLANTGEKVRIDSSGRLLVNHTADVAPDGYQSKLQLCDNSYQGSSLVLRRDQTNTSGATLIFAKSRSSSKGGNAIVNNGDDCGSIRWYGNDGVDISNETARIRAVVDGTPGSNDMPGRLVFFTTNDGASSPTERFQIDKQGRVDHFASDANGYDLHFALTGGSQIAFALKNGATSLDSGTLVMKILGDGDLENATGRYTGISDVKFKENIVDALSQWEDLKAIRVVNFNFKEEKQWGTHKQIGVVAQEIEAISPGLICQRKEENGEEYKSVAYSVLYMKSVKALQEAMDRIETLEAKVTALEGS